MSSQTRRPTSFVDSLTGGTLAWLNVANAGSADGSFATVETANSGSTTSHWLYCTNCGFTIPEFSTSLTLSIRIKRLASHTPFVFSDPYTLEHGNITQSIGAAGNYTLVNTYETPLSTITIPSPAVANASDFGIALRLQFHDGDGSTLVTASVDDIELTINYTDVTVTSGRVSASDRFVTKVTPSDRIISTANGLVSVG